MASAAAVKATCLSGLVHSRIKASPALSSAQRNTSRRCHRSVAPVRALGVTPWILGVAEVATKPGDVDAPIGLIVGGAILVTIVLTAGIPALLSPGNKAAEKIFERDARSGRKR